MEFVRELTEVKKLGVEIRGRVDVVPRIVFQKGLRSVELTTEQLSVLTCEDVLGYVVRYLRVDLTAGHQDQIVL
jgi:hypothetical protein